MGKGRKSPQNVSLTGLSAQVFLRGKTVGKENEWKIKQDVCEVAC